MATPSSDTILESPLTRLASRAWESDRPFSACPPKQTGAPATVVSAVPTYAASRELPLIAVRAYRLPDINRPVMTVDRQVREEPEYYIPDLLSDQDYAPDPALIEATEAYTEEQRKAMTLLDDAGNLLAVLLASQEQECDSRAMETEAVLKAVRKKLRKAQNRIDRQEGCHRNAVLAYFELKGRTEPGDFVTSRDDDANGTETDEPAEVSFDPDVEIHEAMLARERAGGAYPDGDAIEAMEEPLHRLTSAAMLFSNVTMESTEGPGPRMQGLSFLAESISREAFWLFRLYHGYPPRHC